MLQMSGIRPLKINRNPTKRCNTLRIRYILSISIQKYRINLQTKATVPEINVYPSIEPHKKLSRSTRKMRKKTCVVNIGVYYAGEANKKRTCLNLCRPYNPGAGPEISYRKTSMGKTRRCKTETRGTRRKCRKPRGSRQETGVIPKVETRH